MVLPKTDAKSVEERRNEIIETRDDEYLRIVSYSEFDKLPEVKPYKEKPENIRFFPQGLEVLVKTGHTMRTVGSRLNLEQSPIDTSYEFHLIDEQKKRILIYSIDAGNEEY